MKIMNVVGRYVMQ